MSDTNRPTVEAASLVSTLKAQPNIGDHIWGLTWGGKLVEAIWHTSSHLYYDAWCYYPKVPDEVKEIQFQRYAKRCKHKNAATTAIGAMNNTGWTCTDCGTALV